MKTMIKLMGISIFMIGTAMPAISFAATDPIAHKPATPARNATCTGETVMADSAADAAGACADMGYTGMSGGGGGAYSCTYSCPVMIQI